jgi:hypothetical protein
MRFIIVWVLLGSSVAYAQRAPDLATLDRGDGISKVGLDLGFSSLEPPPYTSALRFELYGQYVTNSGFGFYGALPLSRSFGGQGMPMPPEANNATSLSNLDLGFLYVTSGTELSWVFRAGVALPTATSGNDEAATRYYATAPRLTDLVLASSDWHVRLAISPLLHIDRMFLRADLGFDINGTGDYYHFLRFNVGGGIDLGTVALSLELVNTAAFGDFMGEEDFFHAVAFTARFMLARFQPFISVGLPIDDYRRDFVTFFLSGGLVVEF